MSKNKKGNKNYNKKGNKKHNHSYIEVSDEIKEMMSKEKTFNDIKNIDKVEKVDLSKYEQPSMSEQMMESIPEKLKETTTEDGITLSWDFGSDEIADLVVDMLLKNLRNEGFYVQMMNINEGISQARKGSTVLSIKEEENIVTIETSAEAEAFVKTSMYEMILGVIDLINNLKKGFDGIALKKDILDSDATDADSDNQFKKLIKPEVIIANSKAETKDDLLKEMVLLLSNTGNVRDWELVLSDVLSREKIMSTGMEKGIAIPHAKSDGVIAPCVAVCVKKDGIDFGSIDKEPSKIFFMIVSPKKANSPHLQMLASISSIVRNKETLSKILEAKNSDEICKILKEN